MSGERHGLLLHKGKHLYTSTLCHLIAINSDLWGAIKGHSERICSAAQQANTLWQCRGHSENKITFGFNLIRA